MIGRVPSEEKSHGVRGQQWDRATRSNAVPAGELRKLLGVRTVAFQQGVKELAVTDLSLEQ